MKKNHDILISFTVFILFMVGVSLFSYFSYNAEKSMLYEQIDARLKTMAKAQALLLEPTFHARALTASAISQAEDFRNIDRLSALVNASELSYVYSLIEKDGKIYFTSSSATKEERSSGKNLTRYFDLYNDVSPSIYTAIKEHKFIIDEYSDKWGTFRSIIIPMATPNGHKYSLGADMPISHIHNILRKQAIQHFAIALGLLTITFIALVWRLNYIRKLAFFDPLTTLPNRMELINRVNYTLESAQRNNNTLALLFMDLDHFKDINDTLGHKVGDELLIEVAKRILGVLRKADTASRMGGDEFVLLLPFTDAIGASHLAQKLLETISQPYRIANHELSVTASIGIALYPIDGHDHETLSKNADSAMYSAKKEGRNGYQFCTAKLQESSQRYLKLLKTLPHALMRNELYLQYQPQISLQDGHIIGAEVLLRWKHPEFGEVSPREFIPIAEKSGLVLPIGEWVIRTAIREAKKWGKSGLQSMSIAINISVMQFENSAFPSLVTHILHEERFSVQYLMLELTEDVAMHNLQEATSIMRNFNERSIKIAIDSFGIGYSTLSSLQKFQVYKLKIDKSFINNLTANTEDRTIVYAIIAMAHSMGLKVTANGVETQEQLRYLQEKGCDEIQGNYYSKALSSSDFELFVRTHRKGVQFQADTMHHA
ncbi:MAG: EAL domain-containing protein [Sulfuricurvum sp.]|nr:EAL domain-containing protein [Sulfuricurvum sp.]